MQRLLGSTAAAALLLVLLAGTAPAAEARRHKVVHPPSTAGVVGSAMGRLEMMGEIEDETSRLQSAYTTRYWGKGGGFPVGMLGLVGWVLAGAGANVARPSVIPYALPDP